LAFILALVLVLLVINLYGVHREHEAKAAAQRSIDMTKEPRWSASG